MNVLLVTLDALTFLFIMTMQFKLVFIILDPVTGGHKVICPFKLDLTLKCFNLFVVYTSLLFMHEIIYILNRFYF